MTKCSMNNGYSVGVISLGCDKNRVDTEIMLENFAKSGFDIVVDPALADCIVVNTCAFIRDARKEAYDTISEMLEYKKDGNCKAVVVTGCLPIKYSEEIEEMLPEVDLFVGFDYSKIGEQVMQILQAKSLLDETVTEELTEQSKQPIADICVTQNKLYACGQDCATAVSQGERMLSTPSHYAYVKIADGCNNFCSYCTIPYIRGRFRSREQQSIVDECQHLAQNGVAEVILVAQDVTRYGYDINKEYQLVSLLKALSQINGIKKIRLLYCYPELITDALLTEISTNEKISKYIDVPLQHVSDRILTAMNRRSTRESIYALFDKLSSDYPQISVRSTFILGFHGERPRDVRQIVDFLRKYKLRNVGFFAYSREEGTRADTMKRQVADFIKRRRVKRLYAVQERISLENNCQLLDQVVPVTIDRIENSLYVGRTDCQFPDIDGVIRVARDEKERIGEIMVKIISCDAYDLIGEIGE